MIPYNNEIECKYRIFTMRMEMDLYNRLKESATKNKRSIAKELAFGTEIYLKLAEAKK